MDELTCCRCGRKTTSEDLDKYGINVVDNKTGKKQFLCPACSLTWYTVFQFFLKHRFSWEDKDDETS